MTREQLNYLGKEIIGAAIEVHRELGPGYLLNFNVPQMIRGITRKVNKF